MNCSINGQPASPSTIAYRDLGFGQPVDLPLHDFQIIYDRDEFANLLTADYQEFLEDQKADDAAVGDPYPRYLRELGYPDLKELINHPQYLSEMVIEFLWDGLLSRTLSFGPGAEAPRKWVVNSIDGVEAKDATVVIRGKVFERQPALV